MISSKAPRQYFDSEIAILFLRFAVINYRDIFGQLLIDIAQAGNIIGFPS